MMDHNGKAVGLMLTNAPGARLLAGAGQEGAGGGLSGILGPRLAKRETRYGERVGGHG